MNLFAKEKDFYANTIFSEKGHLYQMAYADNAAYNTPFTLHLKTSDGWVIYLKNESLDSKYEFEKMLKHNIGKLKTDSVRRYGLSFSGHWFSRKITENLVASTTEYLTYTNVSSAQKPNNSTLHVLQALRSEYVNTHFYDGRLITSDRRAMISTLPSVGHTTVYFSPFEEGFILYPSGKFKIGSMLCTGGYSLEIANDELRKIFKSLDLDESECLEEIWDLNANNLTCKAVFDKLCAYDFMSSIYYIHNTDWILKNR